MAGTTGTNADVTGSGLGNDRDYRYRIANLTFLAYHGLEKEQLIGQLIVDVLNLGVFENAVKQKLDECLHGALLEAAKIFGAIATLEKPVTAEALVRRVREVLGDERHSTRWGKIM